MFEEKLFSATKLVKGYYQHNNISVNAEIHFVDDIDTAWINFTQNESVIEQYQRNNFTEYHGLCMPCEHGVYHILIRNDYDDYRCTALHEATHAADFDRFRIEFNDGNDNIQFNDCYWAMCLYSEFHARSIGHSYKLGEMQDEFCLEDVAHELTYIYQGICDLLLQFKKGEISTEKFNYELMQYLGRIYSYGIRDLSILPLWNKIVVGIYKILVELDSKWSALLFTKLETKLACLRIFALRVKEENLFPS